MLLQMTPEVQAVMQLQANLIGYFLLNGATEEVAQDFAAEAIDRFLKSVLVSREIKTLYESLSEISQDVGPAR